MDIENRKCKHKKKKIAINNDIIGQYEGACVCVCVYLFWISNKSDKIQQLHI